MLGNNREKSSDLLEGCTTSEVKICKNCGHLLNSNDKYCSNCGKEVE